jgi:uncharacterized protein YhfF
MMPEGSRRIWRLGTPGPMRDRLVSAVLGGEKTATTSLLAEWQEEGEKPPRAGEQMTVVDSDERSVGVIELTAVEVIRLGDANLSLARDEGEGFKTVSEWRETHERFWADQVPADRAEPLTDDTRIVVERFRLVNDR